MKFLKNILSEKTYDGLVEKLGEDLVKQINEKAEDFKIDVAEEKFIPKSKFDEVNNQAKDYKEQLVDRDKQLTELQKSAKGNEELTKQIESLQEDNKKKIEEYETKLKEREKEFQIETSVIQSGAKNVKAVKALLDPEKDITEQLDALKKSDAYLFEASKVKDEAGGDPNKKTDKPTPDEFAEFRKLR